MADRGSPQESSARPRPGLSGRAAKLVPPRDPTGTLDRPGLVARLAAGTERRLTIVTAGAGFGTSTLVANVARSCDAASYTIDATDAHLGAFAAGVVAAIRSHAPFPSVPARGTR